MAISLTGEERGTAMSPELSYTSATSDTPLLGDTIGGNFDRTATRFPGRPHIFRQETTLIDRLTTRVGREIASIAAIS